MQSWKRWLRSAAPQHLDALRSGQAVLLYAPDFVLDENGQTQWGTQAAPFAGCTAVLEYPTLDGAHSQKSLTIGGVIASIDMDSLPFADSSPPPTSCTAARRWAAPSGQKNTARPTGIPPST